MTLKEKILSDNYLEDYENPITDYQADIIVQRADDYAISFTDWVNVNAYKYPTNTTTKELLEIFKKQKGL